MKMMKLYIGLLVLGLVMVAGGLWFVFNSPPRIEIPEGEPVIAMENSYTMAGFQNKLFIYEDGTVIYIEDKGLRPAQIKTRNWNRGWISEQKLDAVMDFIRDINFAELEGSYSYRLNPSSDLQYTITVNYQEIAKTVISDGYFPPDSTQPRGKLPYPLNEIYIKLMDIANSTEDVYTESVQKE